MALDLSKSKNDNSSTSPNQEKKGFNLVKEGSTKISAFNLSKEKVVQTEVKTVSVDQSASPKNKKFSFAIMFLIVVIALGSALWLYNSGENTPQREIVADNSPQPPLGPTTIDKDTSLYTTEVHSTAVADVPVESQAADAAGTITGNNANTAQVSERTTPTNTRGKTNITAESGRNPTAFAAAERRKKANAPAIKIQQTSGSQVVGTLKQKANQVIRGDFGNGEERKQALGTQYPEIQSKVNEIYRTGKQ